MITAYRTNEAESIEMGRETETVEATSTRMKTMRMMSLITTTSWNKCLPTCTTNKMKTMKKQRVCKNRSKKKKD
jgi:hypothetical protein